MSEHEHTLNPVETEAIKAIRLRVRQAASVLSSCNKKALAASKAFDEANSALAKIITDTLIANNRTPDAATSLRYSAEGVPEKIVW